MVFEGFSSCLVQCHKLWITPETHTSGANDPGSSSKKQSYYITSYYIILNCLICSIDWSVWSAAVVTHHFKIHKSSVKTIVRKGKSWNHCCATETCNCCKTLHCWWNAFLSHTENVTLLCGWSIAIRKTYLWSLLWFQKKWSHMTT